jgi:hypothetical protein
MLHLIIHEKSNPSINTSLQVGDLIYARNTHTQEGAEDLQVGKFDSTGTGTTYLVGVLREIRSQKDFKTAGLDVAEPPPQPAIRLVVDHDMLEEFYIPKIGDFLMFSKYSQGDTGVLGYFAKVRIINDSREKAEIFAISSEIIINSK